MKAQLMRSRLRFIQIICIAAALCCLLGTIFTGLGAISQSNEPGLSIFFYIILAFVMGAICGITFVVSVFLIPLILHLSSLETADAARRARKVAHGGE
jgi:hypothetical protein